VTSPMYFVLEGVASLTGPQTWVERAKAVMPLVGKWKVKSSPVRRCVCVCMCVCVRVCHCVSVCLTMCAFE